MSKDAVLRLKSSVLFESLLKKEAHDGFSNKLSNKVETIVEEVSNLLERIPENMPEYTLHDSNHSAKIIEIIGKFLPQRTLDNLNSIEVALIILSAYLHDVGMTASKEERESIIGSDSQYKILFKTQDDKKDKYDYYLSIGDHRSATFLQDQVFTEFLRKNHVSRSADYIQSNLSEGKLLLEINGIPFWKHLLTICNGHGEPVKTIKNTQIYPNNTLVGEKIINVQFLSLLLRLGDILDLDPERTPKIIYEFVNPQDPISILEWKKHRSIIGYSVSPERILFEAECSLPEVERALKQFMGWIETERKQTMQLIDTYKLSSLQNYKLELNDEVLTDRIRSDGSYIYNDLKFEIDYQRVLELLMGQRLYRSHTFSLRELLQNSNDAIKARLEIYSHRNETFDPHITISVSDYNLNVSDNGIGMDFNTFKNYFLQIGKSYYSSPAFYGIHHDIDVTSEFGIGVLSVFIIANSLIVESRKEPDDPIEPPQPIFFEIPTAHSYTIQKLSRRFDIGTTISLKLKSRRPFKELNILSILSELTPYPAFPIFINDQENNLTYKGKIFDEILMLPNYEDIKNFNDYSFDDLEQRDAFTYGFFKIDFTKSANPILNSIQGKLYLVNSGKYNWRSTLSGSFCQRNFSVGVASEENGFRIKPTENIIKLFPRWLSYFSQINLTGLSCLSVTPDRTDVIIDEKYEMLKTLIEDFIISQLKELFENFRKIKSDDFLNRYLDFLNASGFIAFDPTQRKFPLPPLSHDFLSEYITFPVVNELGEIERVSSKEISKKRTIGYVTFNPSEEQIQQMILLVPILDCTIIILSKLHHGAGWEHRYEVFLYNLICNQKGWDIHSVITGMLPAFIIKLVKYNDEYRKDLEHVFCCNIMHSLKETQPQFCIPRQSVEMYMTLNASHNFFKKFHIDNNILKKDANDLISEVQKILLFNIEESIKRIEKNNSSFIRKAFDRYGDRADYYALTNGILSNDPLFLNAFNDDLINKLWPKFLKFKLSKKSEKGSFKFSLSDFPSYWYKE